MNQNNSLIDYNTQTNHKMIRKRKKKHQDFHRHCLFVCVSNKYTAKKKTLTFTFFIFYNWNGKKRKIEKTIQSVKRQTLTGAHMLTVCVFHSVNIVYVLISNKFVVSDVTNRYNNSRRFLEIGNGIEGIE